jgi:pimeloyl-ACP methyl ester carboxylesterase
LTVLLHGPAAAQDVGPVEPGSTFVIVHGAWGGAWDWRTVDRLLTDRGHEVYRVTLTGLGKRSHLASADIGLETHILDVVNEILWEELTDVVLVGHSYGGMVITGAADRVPGRIRELVYIDAFVPEPGAQLVDPDGLEPSEGIVDGMVIPGWEPADKPIPKDMPHPLKSFTDILALENGIPDVPGRYILTREPGAETDNFQSSADRAAARGWPVTVMEAGHVPNRTHPDELVELLVVGWE